MNTVKTGREISEEFFTKDIFNLDGVDKKIAKGISELYSKKN